MHDWNLESIDGIWLLTMGAGENRVGAAALESWGSVLDRVEEDVEPGALVVTGEGKFWSTGLDLDEIRGYSNEARVGFMKRFEQILGRILTSPLVTVAALNGHTVAGGALLALAHDYRIMREDQGYFSLPSVDIGIPFTHGMSELISAKIPQPSAHDLVVSCRNVGGREAHALGVVTATANRSAVLPEAIALASSLNDKDPETLRTVKTRLYDKATTLLLSQP